MMMAADGSTQACSLMGGLKGGICSPPGQVPHSFLCPISMEVMDDPVIIVGSMQTVSRAAVRMWFFLGNTRCPVTNMELESCKTIPNRSLQAAIEEWKESSGQSIKESFVCPILGEEMSDPVVMLGSMQTVSRVAAEQWLAAGNLRCPITNVVLKNQTVIPNFALRGAVEEWKQLETPPPNMDSGVKHKQGVEQENVHIVPNMGISDLTVSSLLGRLPVSTLIGGDDRGLLVLSCLLQVAIAMAIWKRAYPLLTGCNNVSQVAQDIKRQEALLISDARHCTMNKKVKKIDALKGSLKTSSSGHGGHFRGRIFLGWLRQLRMKSSKFFSFLSSFCVA